MITYNRSATSLAAQLEASKAQAQAQVLSSVWAVRLKFVTDLPGQELIYNEKRQEAERFLSVVPLPVDLTGYPFIQAEVGITGATAEEVANVFIARAALWVQVGANLEAIRLTAANGIAAATSIADIDAAMLTLEADLADFG